VAEQRTSVALLEVPAQEQVAPAELWLPQVRAARNRKPKAREAVSCAGVLTFGGEPQPHVLQLRRRTDGNTHEARRAVIHSASSVLWQT